MFLKQGHTYIGGADVPFFVSDSMLKSGGESMGWSQIKVFSRDKFPIFQLPPMPPGTSNDWNTVGIAVWAKPDADMPIPPEIKWAVDTTPQPVITAGPQNQPPPLSQPTPQVEPLPAWFPMPPERQQPTPGGGIHVPEGLGMPFAVGCGVIGGAFFAYQAGHHFFVEGVTPKEKKNILLFAGSVLAVWGATEMLGLNKKWFSNDWLVEKAMEKL